MLTIEKVKAGSLVILTVLFCLISLGHWRPIESGGSIGGERVTIFYYPWYGNPATNGRWIHWQQRSHRPDLEDASSSFYPSAGPYSCADSATIGRQLDEIKRAGVRNVAVSWWGVGSYEDLRLQAILDQAEPRSLKVCVHIEPYGGRTPSTIKNNIANLNARFRNHPAYLKVSRSTRYSPATAPRPVYYVWAPVFAGTPEQFAPVMDQLHAGADNSIVIANYWNADDADNAHVDGSYTYDVYAVDGDRSGVNFASWCARLRSLDLIASPTVGPGYDETRCVYNTRTKPRKDGATYDAMWARAKAANAEWISITSFNEWHEGSQIEPARAKTIASGMDFHAGFEGSGEDGNLPFLNLPPEDQANMTGTATALATTGDAGVPAAPSGGSRYLRAAATRSNSGVCYARFALYNRDQGGLGGGTCRSVKIRPGSRLTYQIYHAASPKAIVDLRFTDGSCLRDQGITVNGAPYHPGARTALSDPLGQWLAVTVPLDKVAGKMVDRIYLEFEDGSGAETEFRACVDNIQIAGPFTYQDYGGAYGKTGSSAEYAYVDRTAEQIKGL